MATFSFTVSDLDGNRSTGQMDAPTLDDAARTLGDESKFVIKLSEVSVKTNKQLKATSSLFKKKVKRSDVIMFANQLAVMISTGVPLSDALNGIANNTKDDAFRSVLFSVTEDVTSGQPLSTAMAKHPAVFPGVMVSLMEASELSGEMGTMLDRIAEYLTKQQRIVKQVRGGIMYPGFMMFMCIGITVFLLTFVMPKFADIYSKKGATLPAPTQFLLGISDSLISNWYLWLGGIATLGISLFMWCKTPTGRRQTDWLKLNSPVVGNVCRLLYLTRSFQTFNTLIEAGIPLVDTIRITKDINKNVYFENLWTQTNEDIRSGRNLSDQLFESSLIPGPFAQMVESGEKSGRLGTVFGRLSEFTQSEFDQAVKNAVQFIEPVMMVVIGSIIGFIAISLLLPIFGAGQAMSGS